jgi:hypothetical protein
MTILAKRCATALAAALAAGALAAVCTARSPAESVVYRFAALRGDASTCQWFDDNLNDRSEGALVRQISLIYNRVALPPGAPVTVTQTATASSGTHILGVRVNGVQLCTSADAIRPSPLPSAPAAPPAP